MRGSSRGRGLLLLGLLLLAGCSPRVFEQACYVRCEQEGRSFEDVEACRATCRSEPTPPQPTPKPRF